MAQVNTTCRRGHRRFKIHESREAWVGFTYPQPNGKLRRFRLLDISVAGFSFDCDSLESPIEVGTTVHDTTIQVADCSMQGDLLIMHRNDEDGPGACGALFYPATDADLVKLKSLIAGLELGT